MDAARNRIFVSHSAEDRTGVDGVVRFLETHGLSVWIAPRDVRPGGDYSEQISDAIESCLAVVVVVTEISNSSRHVRGETQIAFDTNKPILPVRFGAIVPSKGMRLFLAVSHWTDAFGPGRETNLERLVEELHALSGTTRSGVAPAPAPTPAIDYRPDGRIMASLLTGQTPPTSVAPPPRQTTPAASEAERDWLADITLSWFGSSPAQISKSRTKVIALVALVTGVWLLIIAYSRL